MSARPRNWAGLGWSTVIFFAQQKKPGFGVMVTADQSLEYQQNPKGRKLALVVLSTNHIGVLEKHPDRLVAAVDAAQKAAMSL
jgi:hypothetical protein